VRQDLRIGVDLGGTKIEIIALDEDGAVRARRRIATPRGDYVATVDAIASLVQAVETELGRRGSVGVGIPGAISPATGLVKNANSTWLNGQPMQQHLRELLQRPVTLTNDANCLALSEATDGAGQGHHTLFAAILGTGCGAGISVNGQLLTGPNGVAGEWGHNPLPWTPDAELKQRPCFCGRHGCNETFLSGTGLSLTHKLRTGQQLAAHTITDNAHNGDAEAREALNQYLEHLARGQAAPLRVWWRVRYAHSESGTRRLQRGEGSGLVGLGGNVKISGYLIGWSGIPWNPAR